MDLQGMNESGSMPKIGVLIVDDIADTRENLSKLLMFERDIEVVGTAGSGPEAIETCRRIHPDVLLLDINMPEMDGIKAAESDKRRDARNRHHHDVGAGRAGLPAAGDARRC